MPIPRRPARGHVWEGQWEERGVPLVHPCWRSARRSAPHIEGAEQGGALSCNPLQRLVPERGRERPGQTGAERRVRGGWAEGQRGLTLGSQAAHPHPRSGFRGWRAVVCAHHVFASPGTCRRGVLLPPPPPPSARGAPSPSRRRAGRGTGRWLRLCRPCPAFLLPSPGPSGLGPRATPENPHLPGGGAGRGCGSRPEAGAFRTCGSPGLPRVGETEAQTGYDCEPVEDIRGCRDWGEEGPPPHGFPAVRVCAATKWQWRSEINLQAKISGHTQRPLAWQARFDPEHPPPSQATPAQEKDAEELRPQDGRG
ncbi:uncharacterized protein LOC125170129 [Prionailurus viverrinus]|uniref:uncharacterized protein LOC125170129 n=1 Tax=Prionailurus viverrinus TaxID=61388 RepID=UPI001FF66D2A|nr:uncharacterized protein LOC125170129 [Prionailurus viverrinus]XP_047722319.1 uncharacterized protein LOC125170129 [Prionailurus viverrinus]XP_047722320.1 uncharacterized protein LOC125170129 [Prionailurus viverrinus]XP_047722321.1 uncharacterized protein LOC125170129 [Prionailurus viverrinus]XP_047722322.1 uncharacterized protein LOC125170129 [Prionailurus viverrinus]XP_047722323.1 uncharacterized protein LOC125170129 [Prionailurus viverrinus]